MRIKKHGSEYKPQKDLPKYEKFKCDHCGCEFSCEEDEYYVDLGGGDNHGVSLSYTTDTISSVIKDYLVCSCPECHKITKKIRERKNEPFWTSSPTVTPYNLDGTSPVINTTLTCTSDNFEDYLNKEVCDNL